MIKENEKLDELTFDIFQRRAMRTWDVKREVDYRILNAALGMNGEAGEVADLIKKWTFHGHDANVLELKQEIGDVLYYCAILACEYGLDLQEVAKENITKLRARYPDGFDSERSRNRT